MSIDYDVYYEPDYSDEEYRDAKVDEAKEEIKSFLNSNKNKVFYLRQLQVLFEDKYFHWITYNALKELDGTNIRSESIRYKTDGEENELKFSS